MQKLTINIPQNKTELVKQLLKGLGINFELESTSSLSNYKEKLLKVSIWSDSDLEGFEKGKSAVNSLKPEQW